MLLAEVLISRRTQKRKEIVVVTKHCLKTETDWASAFQGSLTVSDLITKVYPKYTLSMEKEQRLGINRKDWVSLEVVKWKSLSRVWLCDPMDYTIHGILQARILDWVAFPFSEDLPNPGIEPRSPALQADSLPAEPPGKPPHWPDFSLWLCGSQQTVENS